MMYRVVWIDSDTKSEGHGDWIKEKAVSLAWAKEMNQQYSNIKHSVQVMSDDSDEIITIEVD